MAQQQSTFIEEMMAAGRGVIGLLKNYREQSTVLDAGLSADPGKDGALASRRQLYGKLRDRLVDDTAIAQEELQTAIRLEPANALAQREMGSLMLASGQPQLAVNFYTRAVDLNKEDRVAQGYLGCALIRSGNVEVGRRFLDRAGPGDWTRCQPIPTLAPQMPGAQAPVR